MTQSCPCSAGPTHKVLTWWVESSATAMLKKGKMLPALSQRNSNRQQELQVSKMAVSMIHQQNLYRMSQNLCHLVAWICLKSTKKGKQQYHLFGYTLLQAKGSNLHQVKEQLWQTPLLPVWVVSISTAELSNILVPQSFPFIAQDTNPNTPRPKQINRVSKFTQ